MALILYASELAACVGMNKYKSAEDVKPLVWERWDPLSFRSASERDSVTQKSGEEVFAALGQTVHSLVTRAVLSETERTATNIVQDAMHQTANATTPTTDKAVEQIRLAKSKGDGNIDEACKTLVGSREIAVALNKSLEKDCSAADIRRVIDRVLVKDVKEARETVVREVNTRRGVQNEHKGIASYEKSKRIKLSDKNSKFYKKCIGETDSGTSVYVGGRVDGLAPDRVIEVKCRRSHFFKSLPIYEKVQTQAYLFLTEKPLVEVVQKLDGVVCSDEYGVDTDFWADVCVKALKFASDLENLIHTTSRSENPI